jgi:cytochrome P450
MSPFELARRMRTNGLTVYGRKAYEEEVVPRRFFGRSSFILNSPELIRHVLVDKHEAYGRTAATIRVLHPLIGAGLLLSEGQEWRRQRRALAPAFTPKTVSLLTPLMLSATAEAVSELGSATGGPVDLFAALQGLTLEIAGRTMFSLEMRQHSTKLRRFLERYGQRLAHPHLLDVLLPLRWPSPHDFARRRFRAEWITFVDQLIEARQAVSDGQQPRDLMDLLMAARDAETGATFTQEQLRDQVATMILAGHETTAVTLFWAFYLLALAPDAQDQVAREAGSSRAPDGHPEMGHLVYTRAVIEETMRLYPPAYVIVRAAREPDELAGMKISRGDLVVVSPWLLHRHRQRWEDPDAFMPERFLPGAPAIDRYAYLPFGIGPRVCIGAQFAITEATLVLSRLIESFRIELAQQRPVMPVGIVTTQPDHHPAFRLQTR